MNTLLRLGAFVAALLLTGLATPAAWAQAEAAPAVVAPAQVVSPPPAVLTDLPTGQGLPIVVRAAMVFGDIEAVHENDETFTGTVDVRLQWQDLRQTYPPADAPAGFREWRGAAAVTQLASMWSPDIGIANLVGEPTSESYGLRLYPDGQVELLHRLSGTFKSPMNVQRFPFDRQNLIVELVSRRDNEAKLQFDFRQDDLAFSHAESGIHVPGWTVGLVGLTRDPLPGWHGESYSRLRVALELRRNAAQTIPGLFIPLFASLLIPLLATWLNSVRAGEFQIEAFELTNIIIGGLFAVIALNFTVNTDRSILATGTNTVSMLFGLNYLTLALCLLINVALFRFNVVRVLWGRHVQHEAYLYIAWALPLLVAATAVALMLVAAV